MAQVLLVLARFFTFPGFFRYLAIIQFIVLVLLQFQPTLVQIFAFDWHEILHGQVWRIISFLFVPALGGFSPSMTILFGFFAMLISFLISDSLESEWGVTRTSLYLFAAAGGQIIANIILLLLGLPAVPLGGHLLYLTAFFAFATLFPSYTFNLFFFLPVPVWILGAIMGFTTLLSAASHPSQSIFIIFAVAPYLAFAIPRLTKSLSNKEQATERRNNFKKKAKEGAPETFHLCTVCAATEASHPERDFRINADGEEICSECLKEITPPTTE